MLSERDLRSFVNAIFSASYQELRRGKRPGEFSWDLVCENRVQFILNGFQCELAPEDPYGNQFNSITLDSPHLPFDVTFVRGGTGQPRGRQRYDYDIVIERGLSLKGESQIHQVNPTLKEGWRLEIAKIVESITKAPV